MLIKVAAIHKPEVASSALEILVLPRLVSECRVATAQGRTWVKHFASSEVSLGRLCTGWGVNAQVVIL